IDISVSQPERLDFAAPPVLGPGLERRTPAPLVRPGLPMLRTAGLRPEKAMAEWRKSSAELKAAKEAVKGDAQKERQKFVSDCLKGLKKSTASIKLQRRVLSEAVENRTLLADFEVQTDDGSIVTVRGILANRERYHQCRCADPIEPGYRDDPRIAYINLS